MNSGSQTRVFTKLAWLDETPSSRLGVVCGLAAFLVPWILYIKTGMREPSINGDYFKMAYIGLVWGIPHATGFPLYLIINGIMSHIPIGGQTFRIMLISATSMALAIHFLYRLGREIKFPPLLALGTVLLAATGRPVWYQGVITDVYALHILLLVATTWSLFKWSDTSDDRWMWAAIWLFILSLAVHPTTLFALPALLIFALITRPRVFLKARTWVYTGFAIVVLLLLYGYIFWRSLAPPAYNECLINGNFKHFIAYLTAADYRTYWGRETNSEAKLWNLFVGLGIRTMGKFGWFAMFAGLVVTAIRNPKRAIPLILIPVGLLAISFGFRDHEPESWLSPIYPFLCLLAVSPAIWLVEQTDRLLKPKDPRVPGSILPSALLAATAVLLAIGVIHNVRMNYGELNLSRPSAQYALASRMIKAVQTPALIITPGYHEDQFILFALFTDKTRKITSHPWVSQNSPSVPVAVTDPWNPDVARSALANGSHVYVFATNAGEVGGRFTVRAVNTGVAPPELYEVFLRE